LSWLDAIATHAIINIDWAIDTPIDYYDIIFAIAIDYCRLVSLAVIITIFQLLSVISVARLHCCHY